MKKKFGTIIHHKIFFLLLCVIFFSKPCYAQNSNLSLGFNFGGNSSYLRTNKEIQHLFKQNHRLYTSISCDYKFAPKWSFQLDVAYELKGAKIPHMVLYDSNNLNTTGEVSFYLNYGYLSLPFLIKYKHTQPIFKEKIDILIGLGGYGGILINRADRIKGYNIKDSLLLRGIVYDDKFDYGLSYYSGLEYPLLSRVNINLGVLLNYGLHNIIGQPSFNNIYPDYKAKNISTNFLVGAKYYLKAKKK